MQSIPNRKYKLAIRHTTTMPPRFHTALPLYANTTVSLPDAAARHAQVLRLQPGDAVTLFNGLGRDEGEFAATITRMGRSEVQVSVGSYIVTRREAQRALHLVVGMPANDRTDWLVEKATELGAASIWPVMTERSVLRLTPERASKKLAHWQAVVQAACEQCGRNRVPAVHMPVLLGDCLRQIANQLPSDTGARLLLSLHTASVPLNQATASHQHLTFLSGPEGGLSGAEEAAARACGFMPVTLGPRVLRAETAALAALAILN